MIAAGYCAVVFDLDGTLADTALDIREALVRALDSEGLPPVDLAAVRLMIGGGPRLLVRRALDRLGIEEEAGLVERLTRGFYTEYKRQNNSLTRLFDGAESTLRQLHETGVRVGLCSNKPDELCRMLARNFELESYIDEILGSDDALPKKPDPAPLLAVIERLGVPPGDTLYVGDSETDVATARAAGVRVMVVDHGYTLRSAGQLGADGVLASLADLVRPGPYAQSA
ncbi:MAG: phosphoglycolate phosphatase [Gammaproteobacteria bacterium]|nr:phosphoglycolate phosphatase [Gammaproteobacteria bacterium]NNF49595.1 phosphoglycolate phosphatase [Woeseiaceae bacterium]MBT8093415.1 phosphoglycolate phosphatase [Gammaproteobacteria bacterium]MBT8106209.1 phosphoglycolate phosphatase [Gammaproteobacteria bacterium]NNK26223.1 phosphoglycolate phosphatase [Woeseiaceae bacterium]